MHTHCGLQKWLISKMHILKGLHTIVPSSKGPYSASILWHCNSMGATTWHFSHIADVFNQGRNVSAVAVTVTCIFNNEKGLVVTDGNYRTQILIISLRVKMATLTVSWAPRVSKSGETPTYWQLSLHVAKALKLKDPESQNTFTDQKSLNCSIPGL